MVFSSVLFTFMFLPIILFLYFLAKDNYKNNILLVASLLFYAMGDNGKSVALMLISIGINYSAGLIISKTSNLFTSRVILGIDIFANLFILYFYKYLDYTITVFNFITGKNVSVFNIVLPIGISFFTFQAMSYVIDVYRKTVPAEKNILTVGLYISFFPQLIAGPIVRYSEIAAQMKKRDVTLEKFGEGAFRFLCGFSKKIILANNLALLADMSFKYENIYQLPVSIAWLGSIAFSLQIFFDFSGYSDMAIGLGKMFGFEFQENFNYPYISKSITEFWRRWHISLSQWFRDYVYIPLGGSRTGTIKHIFNLFVVWVLTGLWHGANATFVAWGLMYFVMLVFEKYVFKAENRNIFVSILWQIVTLLIVNTGWILFNTESFHNAVRYMRAMVGWYGNEFITAATLKALREYGFFLFLGILFSTPIMRKLYEQIEKNSFMKKISDFLLPIGYLSIFIWSISYLILGVHNPFIYFNF